eukprot:TRINITY_DN46007_c0_g1_i1.p1 TRINITY_DN46007_c0_g1~~TRINITY_DN46007_c0_g1_i1.p1  ORF type:complete len:167 (-),score=1.50 TRINITY_DN46007_c0_g1_i1:163-615(-)
MISSQVRTCIDRVPKSCSHGACLPLAGCGHQEASDLHFSKAMPFAARGSKHKRTLKRKLGILDKSTHALHSGGVAGQRPEAASTNSNAWWVLAIQIRPRKCNGRKVENRLPLRNRNPEVSFSVFDATRSKPPNRSRERSRPPPTSLLLLN